MTTSGLHRLPSDELKRLLRALHRGALPSPITRWALIEKGFGNIEGHLEGVVGRDLEAAKAMLAAVLAERASSGVSSVELVYSGIPTPGTRSRDLIEQVRQLLTSATQSVEVYGLRDEDARGLVRTIAAVCDGRDVPGRLVFDVDDTEEARERVRDLVRRSFRRLEKIEVWTGAALRVGLRAVIVDKLRVLVTSGELQGSEDDHALSLGVLVQDPAYIAAWHKEWELLTRSDAGPSALLRLDLR
ncbi:MAG: hypothetical protein QM778_14075 [Myxococcales bacterium]